MDPCVLLVTLLGWLTLCLIDTYSREARGLINFIFEIWKIQGRWRPRNNKSIWYGLSLMLVHTCNILVSTYLHCYSEFNVSPHMYFFSLHV